MFPNDRNRFKFMVSLIWILDLLHTVMICVTNWLYLIQNFGSYEISHTIVWSVAVTICVTAILTFIVHGFFVHRIFSVSDGNWFISVPIVILATGRLAFALLTTTKMLTIGTFAAFVEDFTWSFTLGLCLATAADILITAALCWYLNRNRTGFSNMDSVIDSITLYTIENGLLTWWVKGHVLLQLYL
ncbi:hypothetical protein QCA50_011005 [Cerrena zonata]|uniref:DUF6534 domain-containing protein n=1 Tax=Cerrena zonata TaxID=2478898 RepID=A0AAW0FXX1_9APHY